MSDTHTPLLHRIDLAQIDRLCQSRHLAPMNVSLTPELEKLVQSKVKSGLYNNASEVIREALRDSLKRKSEAD